MLINELLKLNLLLQELLNVAAERFNAMTASLTLVAHMIKSFIILGAHRIASIAEDLGVLTKPFRILQVFKSLSGLYAILGAQLLILVVVFALRALRLLDTLPN